MEDVKKDGPFVRSLFNYDTDFASDVSGLRCEDATMAQQQFKEECDINTIVRNFGLGHDMPEGAFAWSDSDFSEHVSDFQSALNMIKAAQADFMAYPADIRDFFHNDPGRMIAFVQDENNRDKALELGLLRPVVEKAPPMEVRVVPDEGTVST